MARLSNWLSSATWSYGQPHHPDSTRGAPSARRRGVVMSSIRTIGPHNRLTTDPGVDVDCGPGPADHTHPLRFPSNCSPRSQLRGAAPVCHGRTTNPRPTVRISHFAGCRATLSWSADGPRVAPAPTTLATASAPHTDQPSSLITPARSLTASLVYPLREAQSPVSRGTRLTVAGCFHTAVSADTRVCSGFGVRGVDVRAMRLGASCVLVASG